MNINCCCFHGLELERGLRFAFKSVSFEIMEMMEIRIRNTNLKNRDFMGIRPKVECPGLPEYST